MTGAERTGEEEVHATARLETEDGTQEVAGEAWFREQPDAHRIEWGSEG